MCYTSVSTLNTCIMSVLAAIRSPPANSGHACARAYASACRRRSVCLHVCVRVFVCVCVCVCRCNCLRAAICTTNMSIDTRMRMQPYAYVTCCKPIDIHTHTINMVNLQSCKWECGCCWGMSRCLCMNMQMDVHVTAYVCPATHTAWRDTTWAGMQWYTMTWARRHVYYVAWY